MTNTSTWNRLLSIGTIGFAALAVFFTVLLSGNKAHAQLTYNEGFESTPALNTTTLALGWAQGKYGAGTDPDNYWDRLTAGTLPPCTPNAGSMMMRYRSWYITPGEAAFLASKKLDMRGGIPVAGAPISFWMFRDNWGFYAPYADKVQVYLNTTPDMTGTPVGPLVETVSFSTEINRYCSFSPTPPVACNAWNQYSYTIADGSVFDGSGSVYVIIVGTSAFGNDLYIDDFSVTSYPIAQSYTAGSAGVVFQNSTTTGKNQINQMIIGCRMNMSGATTPKTLTSMQFNTNGSDNPPTDITNAKLWFSGGTQTFSTDNAILLGTYNQPWFTNDTFLVANWANYAAPSLNSFSGLEHGDNYFWITYNIPNTATAGNYVDAEWIDFELNGVASATTIPNPQTLPGSRLIDVLYCNTSYTVGPSWAGYNTNDFINSVTCVGDNLPPPGINNQFNTILAACGTSAASGCSVGPFPKNCPFQCHPPDYEQFLEVAGKTTAVTANGTTNYPVTLQTGTYGSGNCIAAWIDFNKDGQFNNWFYEIAISASGTTGIDSIYLNGVGDHPGWRVGMNVSGTGIAPGATVLNCGVNNFNQKWVKLTLANTGTVSGNALFTDPDGEKISQSQYLGALGTYSTTFKVPNTAVGGKTRMRVREVWIVYNIHPCLTYTYGECEDYPITIVPDCPTYPGYTTWLGLTDNWADPSNWCPSFPTPIFPNNVNVRLKGGPSGSYTYVKPVIRNNVLARAQILRIETGDTLFVNAPTGSSLTITDSVKILTPTSALRINTTFNDSAQCFNGTLNRPTDSPLSPSTRSRSWIAFPQADLLSQGLVTGDTITNILIHLQRKSNGNPYKNFTVKYYYATNANTIFNTTFAAVIPPPFGLPNPGTVIWSGDLNPATYVPVLNNFGTIDLVLQTPFAWNGSNNSLVIEICYDNVGFPTTGSNDEVRFFQTTSLRRYMNLESLSTYAKAGCSMTPQDTVWITGTWTMGSPIITVSSAAQAANVLPGQLSYTDGRQVLSVVGTTVTMSANAPNNGTNAPVNLTNVTNTSIIYRPNLTFKFKRPYTKYPVSVGGHWENNGDFTPAVSRVTFNGTVANQVISGTTKSTFYDLDINNSNHVMRMTDFTVQDSLKLINGRLKLNNGMVTLLNNKVSALTRTNGFIQAETDALASNAFPYGRVYWKMGSVPGLRIIPFINASGVSIPMDYNIDSGTHNVILGTYNTLPNNTNLPLPEVTNIFGFDGVAWGSTGNAVVDRYFLVKDSLGVAPVADMTFRYANTERASSNPSGAASMSAQRWINATDLWEFPYIGGQAYTAGSPDQLVINDFSLFSVNTWWTIVGTSTPLPVSLVDFVAVPFKNKVQLKWVTASEINNNHFVVERTVNNNDFSFIGRVESKGPSTNLLNYETWDNDPVEGTQYYYLRQHDNNGRMESFGPVSATFSRDIFDIVTTMVSPTDKGLTVVFSYNTEEPYSYKIIDMAGRVLVSKDKNVAVPGHNVIEIDVELAKGVYQVILQNSEKAVARKFFF